MYRIHIYSDWSYGINEDAASDQVINRGVRAAVVASFIALARAGEAYLTADREISEAVPALAAYMAEQPVKVFTPQPTAAKPYEVTIDKDYVLTYGGASNGRFHVPTGSQSAVFAVLARLHAAGAVRFTAHEYVANRHAVSLSSIPTYRDPVKYLPDLLRDKHHYRPLPEGETIKEGDQGWWDGEWCEATSPNIGTAVKSSIRWRRPIGSEFCYYLRLSSTDGETIHLGPFGHVETKTTADYRRFLIMETGEGMVSLTATREGRVWYGGQWWHDYSFHQIKHATARPFDPTKAVIKVS